MLLNEACSDARVAELQSSQPVDSVRWANLSSTVAAVPVLVLCLHDGILTHICPTL